MAWGRGVAGLRPHSQGPKFRSSYMLVSPLDHQHGEGRSISILLTFVRLAHSTGLDPKLMLENY